MHEREPRFAAGVNYPWTVLSGKPNYGCDFGWNIWGSHAGVTAHAEDVRADFAAMAGMGIEVVRWFVFTDGRGGVRWDDQGRVADLAPGTLEDLDAALSIAASHQLRLCLVLFDYSWMVHREERDASGRLRFRTQPEELATADGQARVLQRLLDPILARYTAGGPASDLGASIHSFDVINEPDWVTRGLALDRRLLPPFLRRRVRRPFTREELRGLVRGVADRVHASMASFVTVGGGRVRFVNEWDDDAYGLDFIQIHSYPDARHPRRDRNILNQPCSTLAVSRPVLIGECPANGANRHPADHRPVPFSLREYHEMAVRGGYLGAWPWSFKGVDDFGPVNAREMLAATRAGRPMIAG